MPIVFGRSDNVTVNNTIVGVDALVLPFPASPGPFGIISSSPDDTVGGSGCQACVIEGLCVDADGDRFIAREEVTMSGQVMAVGFVGMGVGVFRVRSMASSQSGNIDAVPPAPAGDITATIGGVPVHRCKAGEGRSAMLVWSTGSSQPESVRFVKAKIFKPGGGAATSAEAQLWFRPKGAGWTKAGNALVTDKDASDSESVFFEPAIPIGLDTDIKFDLPVLGGEELNAIGSMIIIPG